MVLFLQVLMLILADTNVYVVFAYCCSCFCGRFCGRMLEILFSLIDLFIHLTKDLLCQELLTYLLLLIVLLLLLSLQLVFLPLLLLLLLMSLLIYIINDIVGINSRIFLQTIERLITDIYYTSNQELLNYQKSLRVNNPHKDVD